jgi:hypothetical protein
LQAIQQPLPAGSAPPDEHRLPKQSFQDASTQTEADDFASCPCQPDQEVSWPAASRQAEGLLGWDSDAHFDDAQQTASVGSDVVVDWGEQSQDDGRLNSDARAAGKLGGSSFREDASLGSADQIQGSSFTSMPDGATRDLCLQLAAEVATLRTVLATQRVYPQRVYEGLGVVRMPQYVSPTIQTEYSFRITQEDQLQLLEIMSDDGFGSTGHSTHRSANPCHRSGIQTAVPSMRNSRGMAPSDDIAAGLRRAGTLYDERPYGGNASASVSGTRGLSQSLYGSEPALTAYVRRSDAASHNPSTSGLTAGTHTLDYVASAAAPSSEVGHGTASILPSTQDDISTIAKRMCPGFDIKRPLGFRSRLGDDILCITEMIMRVTSVLLLHQSMAITRCRQVVQSLWPRAQVKTYGSFSTGLSLPSSDVDLVICLPKVRKDAPAEAPGALEGRNAIKETWQQELARRLRQASWVDPASIRIIAHTAIPVIKVQSAKRSGHANPNQTVPESGAFSTGLPGDGMDIPAVWRTVCADPRVSLDISFEGGHHTGLHANRLVGTLLEETPAIRPIVLVLKEYMKERGLMESYSGGLSSYALFLMVARFLQEQSQAMDIGSVLLGFLDFYSNHFDPRATGISVGRRCYFPREQFELSVTQRASVPGARLPPQYYQPTVDRRKPAYDKSTAAHFESGHVPYKFDLLYIEDPMCPTNNVGRNCFRIFQIQRAWNDAWRILDEAIAAGNGQDPVGETELPLLGRILCLDYPR